MQNDNFLVVLDRSRFICESANNETDDSCDFRYLLADISSECNISEVNPSVLSNNN